MLNSGSVWQVEFGISDIPPRYRGWGEPYHSFWGFKSLTSIPKLLAESDKWNPNKNDGLFVKLRRDNFGLQGFHN